MADLGAHIMATRWALDCVDTTAGMGVASMIRFSVDGVHARPLISEHSGCRRGPRL